MTPGQTLRQVACATKPIPCVPQITARIDDITDVEQFPEFAIARAYERGETPSAEMLARANARAERDDRVGLNLEWEGRS